ncbi:asparaginase domain-containing protein [Rhodospira trueperi]|uniref:L-asparaginase/Glu-tRNAGln amidotransferase subunit D n=1 Tax=Rhodospira trueperi TaxID=69960 RepID=A0A1G7HJ84_9PROT|nr:asparaginase domain-containing protein [Rhodospira trueperi]SDF00542.1 L-asparaginase/Glu-tRNAGln amidotransferase subunit D [Rhodospira trueperi]
MKDTLPYAYAGGAVGLHHLYVPRPVDEELAALLKTRRMLVNLRAPRQYGKTSLSIRLCEILEEAGHVTVLLDLRSVIGTVDEHSNTGEKWYGLFFRYIARKIGVLAADVNEWMRKESSESPIVRISNFLKHFIRRYVNKPIFLVIDEIDYVMPHGHYTDYLFEALRLIHADLDGLDLSVMLCGITHPSHLIKASGAGAFNVGHDVVLPDFPDDDGAVELWASGLPNIERRREVSRAILKATGGHPFLTSVLHNDAACAGITAPDEVAGLVEVLLADARNDMRLTPHFETPAAIIAAHVSRGYMALEVFRKLRASGDPIDLRELDKGVGTLLQTAGLVRVEGRSVSVRNPIYRSFFDDDWVSQELRSMGRGRSDRVNQRRVTRGDRKKVCLINCGGTLGMERQPDGTLAQPTDLRQFYGAVPELDDVADIDPLPLMCKDGIHMHPEDWGTIAEAIYARRNDGYSGFVLSHGTDSLAFTASAVAFALGSSLSFPVVFTGSQAPMDVPHGDARPNLIRATHLATQPIPEVCIAFSDKCFRAVRTFKVDDFKFEGFATTMNTPLALVTETVDINKGILRPVTQNERLKLRAAFEHRLIKLHVHPGLDPHLFLPLLDIAEDEKADNKYRTRGIVLETPGVGNIPTEFRWSLLPLIRSAVKRDIPVLITSQFPVKSETRAQYRPATAPLEAGAISAGGMTAPAALVKFMWAIADADRLVAANDIAPDERLSEIRAIMGRDIVGEVDVETTGQRPPNV